jgi:hypothetical protein
MSYIKQQIIDEQHNEEYDEHLRQQFEQRRTIKALVDQVLTIQHNLNILVDQVVHLYEGK